MVRLISRVSAKSAGEFETTVPGFSRGCDGDGAGDFRSTPTEARARKRIAAHTMASEPIVSRAVCRNVISDDSATGKADSIAEVLNLQTMSPCAPPPITVASRRRLLQPLRRRARHGG